MLQCRSCGSTVNSNFCSNCGAQVASSPMRCPRCNNEAAPGTAFCAYCGTALSAPQQQYGAPYPNQPVPQQQNNVGKYLIGALGGAAAAIGGEMLLHGAEKQIERGIEGDIVRREWRGEGHHHHNHHHRRRCHCGHEFGIDIDICPRCRRRWGSW